MLPYYRCCNCNDCIGAAVVFFYVNTIVLFCCCLVGEQPKAIFCVRIKEPNCRCTHIAASLLNTGRAFIDIQSWNVGNQLWFINTYIPCIGPKR